MIYVGWLLIFIGMFFILSGILGLCRFPGFYNKIHAGGVIDVCGIPLCLLGLVFMQENYITALKYLFIIILIYIISPMSTYALARASIRSKIDQDGRVK